jgi:hypothetical protein
MCWSVKALHIAEPDEPSTLLTKRRRVPFGDRG